MSLGGLFWKLGEPVVPGGVRVPRTSTSEALIRRTVKTLLVSLVPMALIVGYNMFLLDLLHGILLHFLPPGLATYIILNYVTFISFIFAATYAAIPLLLARHSTSSQLVD